jgi:hypothetical protein
MRFTAEEKKLLPEGDYDFVVEDAKERTSKKGTPMIEVKLSMSSIRGRSTVFDNLMAWNIADFLMAVGETVTYGRESEIEAYELPGKSGRLHLIVENWEGTDRNKVGKYLPANPATAKASTPANVGVNELGEPDQIPF